MLGQAASRASHRVAVPKRRYSGDSLARPKSSTFTGPRRVRKILAGLTSRCRMPSVCAASSASATCAAMSSISLKSSGRPEAGDRAARRRATPSRDRAARRVRRSRRSCRCSDDSATRRCALRGGSARPIPRSTVLPVGSTFSATWRPSFDVLGAINDAHSARAELVEDLVMPESLSNQRIRHSADDHRMPVTP